MLGGIMGKEISNKELVEGAKKWLASRSNDEWCKKLEVENYLNELDITQNLEWLNNSAIAHGKLINSINCEVTIKEDVRDFDYTSLDTPMSNKESSIVATYEEITIDSKAA